jgi:hypothetical protein
MRGTGIARSLDEHLCSDMRDRAAPKSSPTKGLSWYLNCEDILLLLQHPVRQSRLHLVP